MRVSTVFILLAALLGCGLAGWAAIGPQWRMFLKNPPTELDVLFWSQSQRDSGFALSDKIPMVKTKKIAAGGPVRAFETGAPIEIAGVDLDGYMARQNAAALIVIQGGEIRLERYGLHQSREKRWTSFSVAKSITSTLVGAAIRDGHIGSLEDAVSDYVAGLRGSAYDDVSIRQLLTMTSGVAWNEDYGDPASDVARFNSVEPVAGEAALVTYMKTLGRAAAPGERFNYSTGETNLVGVLVGEAVGMPVSDYLSQAIWRPYGMEGDASWVVSKTGEPISGCCVQATAMDYARFGQFILEGGLAGGAGVLPEGWIAEATSVQAAVETDDALDYGFQWWILEGGAFAALGIFGQGIFIDPARELVMVTHNSWDDASGYASGQRAERFAFFKTLQAHFDR